MSLNALLSNSPHLGISLLDASSSCFLVTLLGKYHSQGVRQAVCLLYIGIQFKEYFRTLPLACGPLLQRRHQQVPASYEQFSLCLVVPQSLRVVCGIAADRIAFRVDERLSALGQVFNHSPEAIPCIGRLRHCLTAVSDAYLLQCFQTELLMVETVKGYHGLGKAGTDNLAHAFGDVKRPTRLSGVNAFSSRYRWTTFTKASSECVSRVAVFSLGLTSTLVRSNLL